MNSYVKKRINQHEKCLHSIQYKMCGSMETLIPRHPFLLNKVDNLAFCLFSFSLWVKIYDHKFILDSNPTITDEIILSEMMKDLNSLNEPSTFDNDDRVTKQFLWMFINFTYHKEIAAYIFIYNWITMSKKFRNVFFKLNRLLNEFDRLISESILEPLKIRKSKMQC